MPRKELTKEQKQELRTRAKHTVKDINKEIKLIASDLAKASCALFNVGLAKEAEELRTRCHHFTQTVVTHPEFMRTWAEWAFENPGQAMRDVAAMGAKQVKVEGEINHRQFVMVTMEDPEAWKKKAIDAVLESEQVKEVIPWSLDESDRPS